MKTDSQLQRDVSAELQWEPSIQAAHIGVEVLDGVVTLAGKVDSYSEKLNAERLAQRVSGVTALVTELKVQIPGIVQREDVDIARAAENVLEWNSTLPVGVVKVKVERGWVTLSGEVDWQYQRLSAADSIRYLLGVIGTSNQIAIKHQVSVKAVKADIEAALKRGATADAKLISVDLQGADITLAGTVRSWAEREIAINSAWAAPGVRKVVDNITVRY